MYQKHIGCWRSDEDGRRNRTLYEHLLDGPSLVQWVRREATSFFVNGGDEFLTETVERMFQLDFS
jgi:hypothetical protein